MRRGRPEAGSTRRWSGVVARVLSGSAALAAAVAIVGVAPPAAEAAPGDLDLTFSGDGKQTTNLGFGFSPARAVARQPDGKLVVVGTNFAVGNGDFAVARYNTDGSLDTSFSGDGELTTGGFGGRALGEDRATGVAIQGDGRIVVVGSGGFGDFALARYNPDGSLDTSFSGDGKQATDFGGPDAATGVALQPDGKVVVVGRGASPDLDFALARYTLDGSLDTTFSGDGKQTTDFSGGNDDGANAVALEDDSKIVAAGHSGGINFALARYDTSGSLDTTFAGDGKQTTDFGGFERANGVALQSDGKIVAVGRIRSDAFALARYNTGGSLDPSFSGDGKQTTDFGGPASYAAAMGVAVQSDGKIVAVGDFHSNGADFAVARYSANGSLDPSFSGDGRQTTGFGGADRAQAVLVQPDGKIVAVGRGGALDFALARYNSDGSLDASFSGDGKQTTEFGGGDGASAVAIQSDGKIVAVGSAEGPLGTADFALVRYDTDGSLDTSFSGDGKQLTELGGAAGVAIQSDGKIVAAGVSGGGGTGQDFAVARYDTDGSLDTSFSGDGKQTTDVGGFEGVSGVAIQGDGKIVVVGTGGFDTSGVSNFALVRYNTDGSLDTSFSGDGKQTTDLGGTDAIFAVALQSDGKIVAVGSTQPTVGSTASDFALARYHTDGSLDTSFSGDGKQTTDFGPDDLAIAVALQSDGKVVAVGNGGDFSAASSTDFALARYNANGSLDTTFSGDGKQTTDLAGGPDGAEGVAIQGDSKIVAVGLVRFSPFSFSSDFALARYDTNGSLDTTFAGDGKQTTDFGDFDDARAVALQGDGKIVAVGGAPGPSQTSDFALARYLGG